MFSCAFKVIKPQIQLFTIKDQGGLTYMGKVKKKRKNPYCYVCLLILKTNEPVMLLTIQPYKHWIPENEETLSGSGT